MQKEFTALWKTKNFDLSFTPYAEIYLDHIIK